MIDHYKNYGKHKTKAEKLMEINRKKYTLNKMGDVLKEMLDPILPKTPEVIPLNLPDLKKINAPNLKKLKLPNTDEMPSLKKLDKSKLDELIKKTKK